MKIAVLPGDGIGPEIIAEAVKVLQRIAQDGFDFTFEFADVGGAAYAASGHPLPEATLSLAKSADAVLFGAVGDWKYDTLERHLRPEQAILGLRKNLGLFANLRPAILYAELADASSLKPEVVSGLDILIVRELTGDIYFGQPRGRRTAPDGAFAGQPEAFDTMRYSRPEIERIAHVAFKAAQGRNKRLTSVDKANVLETFQFWKDIVTESASSTLTCSSTICMWTTPQCSSSRRRKNSTSSSPAICSATSSATRRRCSPAPSACCRRRR